MLLLPGGKGAPLRGVLVVRDQGGHISLHWFSGAPLGLRQAVHQARKQAYRRWAEDADLSDLLHVHRTGRDVLMRVLPDAARQSATHRLWFDMGP